MQPKNVTHPTDAKAIERLGVLAKRHGVALRQSYARVAKRAALMAGRYIHAKQFKRANRELRFLRTRLGGLSRDIARKTRSDPALKAIFDASLRKAHQIRWPRHQARGAKLYSWHAPETECIGKSLPRRRPGARRRHMLRRRSSTARSSDDRLHRRTS